jgi:molybdate transport system ATP-binding protein
LVDIRQTDVAMDGVRILHGLNWQWRRGEHWMITGENGSGKSTFLRLLVGDAVPELGGAVQRRGLANHASIWEIRELVGIVSPEWQARLAPHAPAEIIVASGFTGALAHFTDTAASHLVSARALLAEWGARQLATRPFGELSYGQSRFVTLLRAVVAAPRLLLLDEVFDGLDREWHERARALVLREAGRGAHLLIVSHHPEEIAGLYNRQATFRAGRMMLTDGGESSREAPTESPTRS